MNGQEISALATSTGLGLFTLYWFLRKGSAHSSAADRITSEGGQITKEGSIGMLVADPFTHATSDAAGHYFKVRYGARTGTWFVRTSRKRPDGEWLWVDDAGEAGLPVQRLDDSRAVAAVRRIPHWVAAVMIGGLVLAGVLAGMVFGRRH